MFMKNLRFCILCVLFSHFSRRSSLPYTQLFHVSLYSFSTLKLFRLWPSWEIGYQFNFFLFGAIFFLCFLFVSPPDKFQVISLYFSFFVILLNSVKLWIFFFFCHVHSLNSLLSLWTIIYSSVLKFSVILTPISLLPISLFNYCSSN